MRLLWALAQLSAFVALTTLPTVPLPTSAAYAPRCSAQVRHRNTFGADWYVLSDLTDLNMTDILFDTNVTRDLLQDINATGGAANSTKDFNTTAARHLAALERGMLDTPDAFVSQLGGFPYAARLLDYGAIYASKTMRLRDGQVVWFGWVYEVRCGQMGG